MITHDLGVVAGICDQVMVMYAGRTMEYGTAEQIFYHPTHPYSIGLMDAIPRLDGNEEHIGNHSWQSTKFVTFAKRLSILTTLPICYRTMPNCAQTDYI